MRKIRVSVTDEDGVLLDTGVIEISDIRRKISVVALDSDEDMVVSDLELQIGAPPKNEEGLGRPSKKSSRK